MNLFFKKIFLIAWIFFLTAMPAQAGMEEGLQCPPAWQNNISSLGNDLIKQCLSPKRDAVIELYAAPGNKMNLGQLLDAWVTGMNAKGMPFQQRISEVPGQISGIPALTRVYRGNANGQNFESSLVASHYDGSNYIFQALYAEGRPQIKSEARQSMNTWVFPDREHEMQGTQGSRNAGNSPPLAGTQNNSCCFAYGLWNITNSNVMGRGGHGISVIILPDGRLVIQNKYYKWECLDSRKIRVQLPASMGKVDTWTVNSRA
jgi:hypothetical protein